jgi:hypothetical protein
MKTFLLLALAVLFINYSNAQIGVLTLKKREHFYYGQWFALRGTENSIFLIDQPAKAEIALERVLMPYGLTTEDGDLDEDGDLFWVIQSDNGFVSKVFRMEQEDGNILLAIMTEELQDEEDEYWYEKISRR